MIDMDLLSVIRRWHFRQGIPIREIRRRTGLYSVYVMTRKSAGSMTRKLSVT